MFMSHQISRNISKAFYSNVVSDVSHISENIELSVGKQNETFVVLKFIYSGELLSLQIDLQIGSWQHQGISVELVDYVEQKDVDS
jgi:hypothetical protein